MSRRAAPRRRTHAVQAGILARGRDELDADGQPVLLCQARRNRDAGDAGQVHRNRGDVVEVHLQRVVDLLAELERGGRSRRRRDDIDLANAASKSRWMSVRTFWALP
jgi:hypothetical protein